MNTSPLLINDEFVSYFPALGRALGSVEDAVLVQMLWYRRDRDTGETEMTAAALAEQVGMKVRTTERRLSGLISSGVLSKRRKSAYDPTSVWSIHHDKIDVSAGQTVTAKVAVTRYENGDHETAKVADSVTAKVAVTIPKEREELPPSPQVPQSRRAGDDVPPSPPQAGGACVKHPDGDGVNCRGCGSTNRQRARSESAEAAALRRRQDAEALARARAGKPDPEVGHRGAEHAREALAAARAAGHSAPAATQRPSGASGTG
jgi:hypothetical protein